MYNGSDFTSKVFTDWTSAHDIYIDYIDPGSPYQNAYIEQFNRSYRNEILDCYLFNNLNEVSNLTESWIKVYNTQRPHDSLKYLTPAEYRQVA
ncbi:transposase [Psychrobacter raelei]|uniref:transposase n=1 Tax=Psychrobacter raelei TaxID=2565531 RepID=UPI003F5F764B